MKKENGKRIKNFKRIDRNGIEVIEFNKRCYIYKKTSMQVIEEGEKWYGRNNKKQNLLLEKTDYTEIYSTLRNNLGQYFMYCTIDKNSNKRICIFKKEDTRRKYITGVYAVYDSEKNFIECGNEYQSAFDLEKNKLCSNIYKVEGLEEIDFSTIVTDLKFVLKEV